MSSNTQSTYSPTVTRLLKQAESRTSSATLASMMEAADLNRTYPTRPYPTAVAPLTPLPITPYQSPFSISLLAACRSITTGIVPHIQSDPLDYITFDVETDDKLSELFNEKNVLAVGNTISKLREERKKKLVQTSTEIARDKGEHLDIVEPIDYAYDTDIDDNDPLMLDIADLFAATSEPGIFQRREFRDDDQFNSYLSPPATKKFKLR